MTPAHFTRSPPPLPLHGPAIVGHCKMQNRTETGVPHLCRLHGGCSYLISRFPFLYCLRPLLLSSILPPALRRLRSVTRARSATLSTAIVQQKRNPELLTNQPKSHFPLAPSPHIAATPARPSISRAATPSQSCHPQIEHPHPWPQLFWYSHLIHVCNRTLSSIRSQ